MSRLFLRGALPGEPGSVRLVTGPMFSGKSSEIIRAVEVAQHASFVCFLVRPDLDTRWPDAPLVRTHSQHEPAAGTAAELVIAHTMDAAAAAVCASGRLAPGRCLVAVDEAQFLGSLRAGVERLVQQGAHVVVAALDGDFEQRPFPGVSGLYPLCDAVEKLSAVCGRCRQRGGIFTVKRAAEPGAPPADVACADGSRCEVGGADKYQAVCRLCLGA